MVIVAVVRVRGSAGRNPQARSTLIHLSLPHVHNCNIAELTPNFKGMLDEAHPYITWGEVDKETLTLILEKRANIDDGLLKNFKVKTHEGLSEKLLANELKIKDVAQMPLRLHPPKKGYGKEGVKEPYKEGGAFGYRGKDINDLLKRMV